MKAPHSSFPEPSSAGQGTGERPIRLRPGRSKPKTQKMPRVWGTGFRSLMRFVQMQGKRAGRASRPTRAYSQRVAVRVLYSKNKNPGQWKAHGRYIERESANLGKEGFGSGGDGVPIASTLDGWQKAQDEHFFKVILSPEFGDRMDLKQHTHDTIRAMERDLGTPLEWVAAVHRNTDNPHVHVAIRGRDAQGQTLRIPKDYIKQGMRDRAQDAATAQIGYRQEQDVLAAQIREAEQIRYTGLDRKLAKRTEEGPLMVDPNNPMLKGLRLATELHLQNRLGMLARLGLATQQQDGSWELRSDHQTVLRALQKTGDRQKVMTQHGVLASDPRLPIEVLDRKDLRRAEGRILVHGEEEWNGRPYLLLENIEGKIQFLYHNTEIQEARRQGLLQPNSYAVLHSVFADGKPRLGIEDLGDAELLLGDKDFFRARRATQQDFPGWTGWLGRFQAASARNQHPATEPTRSPQQR